MKPLVFYPLLLAILFQTSSASSSSNNEHASLKSKGTTLRSGKLRSMAKPVVVRKLIKNGKPQSKHANVVPEGGKPKLLTELLLKELVEIAIGYFDNNAYSILVSTRGWLLAGTPRIAVDSARLYVMTDSKGVRGFSHLIANLKEDKHHGIEFGNSQWFSFGNLSSSHDGRYVFFSHLDRASTDRGEQNRRSTKWFTQDSRLEGGKPKRVAFGGECLSWGMLSRDGQRLFSYNTVTDVTRAYRIVEGAGKRSPTAFMQFKLNGMLRAVSGDGSRVMVLKREHQLEIHDIGNGASKLVCQVNTNGLIYRGALNENGSEAAFIKGDELRIMKVNEVVGSKLDQPAIVSAKVPTSSGSIIMLVYSDENKLHVLHFGGGVSLFNPSSGELVLIETPQKGRYVIKAAISPKADYIATLQCVGKETDGKRFYITTVKRKLGTADWKNLFGYERVSSAKSSVLAEKALTQTRNALPQSAPRIRLTTISVQEGSLCAFDGNLRCRYVLDDVWVIHRSAIDSGGDRGSVKLPTSLIKGAPQHLQVNSDGTVFYVATKRSKRRYIYVIDVASKRVYGYRLKHLESDIVEIKAHLGGKVLEVVTQDQLVLVFSCSNQKLSLRNKLIEGERVVGVSRSIAVFEDDEAAGPTIGFFDLTKTAASLFSLPYRNARFVAVDKDDVYLTSAKSILRFNTKTKGMVTIEEHYAVRSSHVHDGSIRIMDHDFVYRVLDIETLRQLYEVRLPLPVLQKDKPQISMSTDGRRVMVRHADVAYLFEIVDPEFTRKMQTIKRTARAKPVKRVTI